MTIIYQINVFVCHVIAQIQPEEKVLNPVSQGSCFLPFQFQLKVTHEASTGTVIVHTTPRKVSFSSLVYLQLKGCCQTSMFLVFTSRHLKGGYKEDTNELIL